MSQRAPSFIQRLHLAFGHSSLGGIRFRSQYHSFRPILERNHVTISRLSSSSSIVSGRCGGPAVSAGNKERGEEGGKSIRNSAEAFPLVSTRFMVVTSIVTEDIRFCYRFLRCLCNCEHHPPIVVYFFPPPWDCTACVHTVYGRGRVWLLFSLDSLSLR